MPVHLRGHHFLCMLTYSGLGYSHEFTANMSEKIGRVRNGAPLILIEGPDDICAGMSKACAHATGHDCRGADILSMDLTARNAVETVLKRNLAVAKPVSAADIDLLRTAFANSALRAACQGCSWFEICTTIAANKFTGTHLMGTAS
jgi:uncharacterized protein